MTLRLLVSPRAVERRARAAAWVGEELASGDVLILGATRAAADELAAQLALERGALFGVARAGLHELQTRLALPALARAGAGPAGGLAAEAIVTRAVFEAAHAGEIEYFGPVAALPGFARAASRTIHELQMAGLDAGGLERIETPGRDLAALITRAETAAARAGAAPRAAVVAAARTALADAPAPLEWPRIVLLDVPIATEADAAFVRALVGRAASVLAVVPEGDSRAIEALAPLHPEVDGWRPAGDSPAPMSALMRLQRHLFSDTAPPPAATDESVDLFSAPGEGREAVEIARRLLAEAARGVPFDEMAVVLRAPQTYLGVMEHALDRAGIPAWFHRGTRRPDPSGRALLALLLCAEEHLSARRFAEYISLGQVPPSPEGPPPAAPGPDRWVTPAGDGFEGVVPMADRPETAQPEDERRATVERGETRHDIAGTLRAPWRWEDLIVEAAVIGGLDRWRRRLAGLAREYDRRLREAESDDPEASRARAIARDREQLESLRAFAEPVLAGMAAWPREDSWGGWLAAIDALAVKVLAHPERVQRVLAELTPLEGVGPVTLGEVREVLAPRLATLTYDPPRRRHGRVFVGTPEAVRGRAFRVVFVPGLAERLFPQRLREDALLPDEKRRALGAALPTGHARAAEERQHLRLAVGAAAERVYLSFPRVEMDESRPRVPSFYVLDAMRAVEGGIPSAAALVERAHRAGGTTLAWPAPVDPSAAVDDFEHDLATLAGLMAASDPGRAKGRARYLYELSPELRRSLTARWLRWHRRAWDPADGLVRALPETTGPALARERLDARPYSLTALQRYAACPYQFLLAAIYRLAPIERPAPLQRLDPLTRGDLFHRIQAEALRRLREHGLLPLDATRLPAAQKLLEWAVTAVDRDAYDDLAPAIDRVWRDELAAMTRDLKLWLERLAEEGAEWTPERFEFAFGLGDAAGRDPTSTRDAAAVGARFRLRGSIDVIERHRETRFLRVTDHKTGRRRTEPYRTIVHGGRILQPVVYGLALEALWPDETVYSGRLFYCTSAGGFETHEIPLLAEARRCGIEALEIVDRAIARGLLAAHPADGECGRCDFIDVCGRDEERRTRRKEGSTFADLDALRNLP